MDRRRLIQWVTAASGIYLLRGGRAFADVRAASRKTILVLGGTSFLGPAVVRAAVIGGHEVTLFNRGITNPELFPFLEKLRGFRSPKASEENWTAIGSRRWDAIIDVWPSDPRSRSRPRDAFATEPIITSTSRRSRRTTREDSRSRTSRRTRP